MKIEIRNITDLPAAAETFMKAMRGSKHFAFHAPMGAGKTTFISELCKILGAEDEASSPTFSIVNEYAVPGEKPVFHFDFYRIETVEELLDMGLDDYWDSGAVCLMEWPENALDFLPEDTVDVNIEVGEDGSRVITADLAD
ncbi:MAG: tRNA (adenosine(37)-N6)-threonylcarbamoyltransferase complex ATPase subunit type 1 TsaE [Muribaculaceae bacterium]|nr:tRNA (adenosine(37)-N6)-threonylcarbamoyltransferase complex ATPase subunit type 1 TsaE [Muribaculaceae bacterium]